MLQYWKSNNSTINTPFNRSRHAKQQVLDLRFIYKDPVTMVSSFKLKSLSILHYCNPEWDFLLRPCFENIFGTPQEGPGESSNQFIWESSRWPCPCHSSSACPLVLFFSTYTKFPRLNMHCRSMRTKNLRFTTSSPKDIKDLTMKGLTPIGTKASLRGLGEQSHVCLMRRLFNSHPNFGR